MTLSGDTQSPNSLFRGVSRCKTENHPCPTFLIHILESIRATPDCNPEIVHELPLRRINARILMELTQSARCRPTKHRSSYPGHNRHSQHRPDPAPHRTLIPKGFKRCGGRGSGLPYSKYTKDKRQRRRQRDRAREKEKRERDQ